ncbi:hypothetical protein BGX24_007566 [Mortierella sp. AD032]|nr:hypothetical protein BGX24_007566 [Mortierella sp. AD032]
MKGLRSLQASLASSASSASTNLIHNLLEESTKCVGIGHWYEREAILSLGETHTPLEGSAYSWDSSKSDRSVPATVCHDTKSSNRRWTSRSEEEKRMALKALLEWRKDAYEMWVSSKPYRYGCETWMLPDNAAKLLSQNFSGARTAKAVKAIACHWTPLCGEKLVGEVAQVLDKLNNEIDARRGSGSQTTVASELYQSENGFNGDGERSDNDGDGSDGEENLPESESDSLAAACVTDQQPLGDQPPPAD